MSITLTNIILLLASAQGLFLTVLILSRYRSLYTNRFLAGLIFFYSVGLLYMFFWEIGLAYLYPNVILYFIGFLFVMVPLHYLYTDYLIHPSKRFRHKDLIHFLPFIVVELSITIFLVFMQKNISDIVLGMNDKLPLFFWIINWSIILQALIYLTFIIKKLNQYSQLADTIFSFIGKVRLNWLRYITYLALFTLSVFIFENFLLLAGINLSDNFNLSSILVAGYVYALGYTGLFKTEIFTHPQIINSINQITKTDDSIKIN